MDEMRDRVLFVCRHPGRRALVERVVQPSETYASAIDAILAVARRPARAVLVNLEDIEGSAHSVLAALKRAQPGLPVYALVKPEDEPLGRGLLREGAADYFVLPGEVRRLPAVLYPHRYAPPTASGQPPERPCTDAPAPAATAGAPGDPNRLFKASCALSELALAPPHSLFAEGARIILRALEPRRGCAFSCGPETGRLEPAVTLGPADEHGPGDFEVNRAPAELALRTGDVLFVKPDAPGAPPGGLLCVPVREAASTFGVICLSGKAAGSNLAQEDRDAALCLARILARLYQAAVQREQYASLALRDVETGLLKDDPFLTYLETLIARSENRRDETCLLLLEPEGGPRAHSADILARLGRAIHTALPKGCQGGRLGTGRFAVTLSQRPGETATALDRSTADDLASLGPQVDASVRLRVAMAVFPRDGATAKTLTAVAEARLKARG